MSLFIEALGVRTEVEEGGACTVGRRGDLRPDDVTLSKAHFRVQAREGGWWIEDLGSAAGTWLNGAQLRRATALKDGDEVRAGRTDFRFHLA